MLHQIHSSSVILVGSSLVALALFGLLWRRNTKSYKSSRNDKLPVRWRKVGEVSGLMFYPLKSGRGLSLNKAECATLGLVDIESPHIQLRDREFIVFDPATRKAVSGLVNSRMVLVGITPEDEKTVRFSFSGEDDFYLKLPVDTSKVVVLNRWWGEQVTTVDCGDDVAHWFSQAILNKPCSLRLGHFSQPTVMTRTLENGWSGFAKVYQNLRSEYLGAYSYMASYLIITEKSVEDVNSRLSRPVTEQHYRANITVRGSKAYSEDSWDWLRLGETVIMRGFKPCTRCAVIAIDPDTGKLDSKLEPLRTLKQYRQVERAEEKALAGNEPVFGLYAGLHTPGMVHLGDPVYIGTE